MNPQIQALETKIQQLLTRIVDLESKVSQDSIRNIVFFDQDTKAIGSSSTTVVTGVNFAAQTVTTASVTTLSAPAKFIRTYYRGKALNVPTYNIS